MSISYELSSVADKILDLKYRDMMLLASRLRSVCESADSVISVSDYADILMQVAKEIDAEFTEERAAAKARQSTTA